nr:MAG TPA: N-acetyl-beta-D-glucosaminidase N-terminal domain [Bacteriophage sp.]
MSLVTLVDSLDLIRDFQPLKLIYRNLPHLFRVFSLRE